jgi:hypothetical protein
MTTPKLDTWKNCSKEMRSQDEVPLQRDAYRHETRKKREGLIAREEE